MRGRAEGNSASQLRNAFHHMCPRMSVHAGRGERHLQGRAAQFEGDHVEQRLALVRRQSKVARPLPCAGTAPASHARC